MPRCCSRAALARGYRRLCLQKHCYWIAQLCFLRTGLVKSIREVIADAMRTGGIGSEFGPFPAVIGLSGRNLHRGIPVGAVVERYDKRIRAWAFDSYHSDLNSPRLSMNRVRALGERPRHRSLLHHGENAGLFVEKPTPQRSEFSGARVAPHRFVTAADSGSSWHTGPLPALHATEGMPVSGIEDLKRELRELRCRLGAPDSALPVTAEKLPALVAAAREKLSASDGDCRGASSIPG